MDEDKLDLPNGIELPNLEGYVSVKEAAQMLGLSTPTIYTYVAEGRIKGAVRAADVILLPIEAVQNYQRGPAGRKRIKTPEWHISAGKNTQFVTKIIVRILPGRRNRLLQKLEQIRSSGEHIFPGTVARTITESRKHPGQVTILLTWRAVVMPDDATREAALEAFRRELADVLDWSTAQYDDGQALMHT